jgi:hypothetical protein
VVSAGAQQHQVGLQVRACVEAGAVPPLEPQARWLGALPCQPVRLGGACLAEGRAKRAAQRVRHRRDQRDRLRDDPTQPCATDAEVFHRDPYQRKRIGEVHDATGRNSP